jgi:hypothetical protein
MKKSMEKLVKEDRRAVKELYNIENRVLYL